MACKNCRYFVADVEDDNEARDDGTNGICKRFPPEYQSGGGTAPHFPRVNGNEQECGSYKYMPASD